MRWLAAVAILLAGCSGTPASGPGAQDEGEPTAVALAPDANDLRSYADADAKAWDPAARLVFIAAFEGDLPFWNQPLLPTESSSDPWVDPYRGLGGEMADGRSPLWSYSYVVDDEQAQLARMACEQGQHVEARTAHVVTVDAAGAIVASYETRNDDQGSPMTGFVPDGLIGSATAAANAAAELRLPLSQATFSRTFLAAEWYYDQPVWMFLLDNDDSRWAVAVDATTGDVMEAPPAAPKC